MIKKIILSILAFSCILGSTFAQNQDKKMVNIKFEVYLWPSKFDDRVTYTEAELDAGVIKEKKLQELKYLSGSQLQVIKPYPGKLTGPYSYRGPSPLTFVREEVVEGVVKYIPIGTAKIPPGSKRKMLLVYPQPDRTYKVFVADNANVSPGTGVVYNLTKRTLAAKLGKGKPFNFPPGSKKAIDLKEFTSYLIKFDLRTKGKDGWESVYKGNRPASPKKSLMYFIYDKPKQSKVGIITLDAQKPEKRQATPVPTNTGL